MFKIIYYFTIYSMFKDTLLICSITLIFVLLYRMYTVSQKINNLEEKVIILDNFSQSIFKYIMSDEHKERDNIITYSNQENNKPNQEPVHDHEHDEVIELEHKPEPSINTTIYKDVNSETHEYNVLLDSVKLHIEKQNQSSSPKVTEKFESKEIISELVSQLKETLIEDNATNLQNELIEVEELKKELKQELITAVESDDRSILNEHEKLYDLLNNSDIRVSDEKPEVLTLNTSVNTNISSPLKKKEEELLKMKISDLKTLAKKKNIPLMESNKPKKKETLVQNLLSQS